MASNCSTGILNHFRYKLVAIYNGIRGDLHRAENLSALRREGFVGEIGEDELAWKKANQRALQEKLGLEVDERHIVVGIPTRLVKQKGFNVLFTPVKEGGKTAGVVE